MRLENDAKARIWVAHDGELDDVCRLLDDLGAAWRDVIGPIEIGSAGEPPRAVISTPRRLLETRFDGESGPLRVAIVDRATRTVVAMLRRSGVERIVTRPVHPAALRALMLHLIYCGPEKRRRQRVSVGAAVRFRTGLWPRHAVLAELSTRGCRLLTPHSARRDAIVQLTLPSRVTGNGTLSLRGRVVRTGPASGEEAGTQALVVIFSDLDRGVTARLQKLVDSHASGPASLPGTGGRRRRRADAPTPIPLAAPPADSPESSTGAEPSEADATEAAHDGSDRRTGGRSEYEQSVIALSVEAARVLIGRDVSLGGMRVEPHDDLELDDELQLALHVGRRAEPLVVRARVDRDDGERGLILTFEQLSDGARDFIAKMVDDLPTIPSTFDEPSVPPEDEEEAPFDPENDAPLPGEVIVSEILERVNG